MHNRFVRHGATAVLVVAGFVVLTTLVEFVAPDTEADTLTVPVTFVDGTVIQAADFNSNFDQIEAVVNGNLDDTNLKNSGITASDKLIDSTVSLAKMASDSVDSSKIVDASVALADMAADSVNGSKVVDGSLGEVELDIDTASGPGVDGQVLYWNDGASKLDYKVVAGASTDCTQVHSVRGDVSETGFFVDYFSTVVSNSGFSLESGSGGVVDHAIAGKAITAHNLRVEMVGGGPGGDDSYVIALAVNGSTTGLTCTITSGTSCSDTSNTVAIGQGSNFEIRFQLQDGGDITDDSSPAECFASFCTSPY